MISRPFDLHVVTHTPEAAIRQPILPHVEVGTDVARSTQFDGQALDFLRAHPDVWRLFVHFVAEAHARGASRIGAKLVCERIRWEHAISDPGDEREFIVNNNHVASIARIYCEAYPEHASMFITRARPSERVRARSESVTYDHEEQSHG